MKRGVNEVYLTGKISTIIVGETAGSEDSAASFLLIYGESKDGGEKNASFVRVNAYGHLARLIATSIRKDDMVFVKGEMMTRLVVQNKKRITLSEIRGRSVYKIKLSSEE